MPHFSPSWRRTLFRVILLILVSAEVANHLEAAKLFFGEVGVPDLGACSEGAVFGHLLLRQPFQFTQTVAGVRKELLAFALVYNLVRAVTLETGNRLRAAPDRVSFVHALRWLGNPCDRGSLPPLIIDRERPGRFEPRVRKRPPPECPLMTEPRPRLRIALIGETICGLS